MFRNFTPHALNIILPDGSEMVLPSEGVARVGATTGSVSPIDGIPVADGRQSLKFAVVED
jgi:hypothetical protein